jgi:hypothetical protein
VKPPDVGRNTSFYCRGWQAVTFHTNRKMVRWTYLHGLLGRQRRSAVPMRVVCVPGPISQHKLSGSPSLEKKASFYDGHVVAVAPGPAGVG